MTRHILTAVAWPYANGPRHIGHVSGFGVPSDVFSRYQRMAGNKVLMVSGTDEHGTPILVQAEQEGVTARQLADRYNRVIVDDLQGLGLSYDLFTRTTTRNHYAVAQELFKTLHRNGYLIAKVTQGAISPSTGRTLPDRYIEGTCPICGYDGARGDQCDNCGNQLDPIDLINPRSRINGETPKFVETEHFFLDLPALADALGEWLRSRTDWRPNVLRFSLNLLDDLKPRAMTRDIDWGIPVPLDGWRDNPTKRLYVWFDAVIGYLSASIEWARRLGEPDRWREWWNEPEALSYYFMGKDNITFHSQIWPAELLAYAGGGRAAARRTPTACSTCPPRSSAASSSRWRASSSPRRRRSSSTCATCWPATSPTPFATSSRRPARRARTATSPGRSSCVAPTTNSSPAGQPRHRAATPIAKNFGEIPTAGPLEEGDVALLARVEETFTVVGGLIGRHRQKAAISEAMKAVGEVNKYITDTASWTFTGEDQRERLATVLHVLAQCVVDLNTILSPFLPHAANAVDRVYGGTGDLQPMPRIEEVSDLDDGSRAYPVITGDYSGVRAWRRTPVAVGASVAKPTLVFTKLNPSVVNEELAGLA